MKACLWKRYPEEPVGYLVECQDYGEREREIIHWRDEPFLVHKIEKTSIRQILSALSTCRFGPGGRRCNFNDSGLTFRIYRGFKKMWKKKKGSEMSFLRRSEHIHERVIFDTRDSPNNLKNVEHGFYTTGPIRLNIYTYLTWGTAAHTFWANLLRFLKSGIALLDSWNFWNFEI